jgi:hypothetical protein
MRKETHHKITCCLPAVQSDTDMRIEPTAGCLAAVIVWTALGWAQDADVTESRMLPNLPRLKVDDARAAQLGIRKLTGKHLTLYTDLPSNADIDAYPAVFDQAFPQWCAFFGVSEQKHASWHMLGFLMRQKRLFREAGMLPADLREFANGYSRNYELWLYDQPSDYYRRHLFVHEGTHGFMNTVLGACGPPWYMEALAELFGTHRWQDGKLTTCYMPRSRDEVPMWGRVRLIQDAVAARRARQFREVVEFDRRAHSNVDAYAWSWAAGILLERHPRYHDRFRKSTRYVAQLDFSDQFERLFAPDWQMLSEEWQLMVVNMEYGYDVARNAVDFRPGAPLPPGGAKVVVAADRGWQNSGLRLEAGKGYQLLASGRYTLAQAPKPWPCEPNGVTIRYYKGQPLGLLLAAVRPDDPPPGSSSALLRPWVIGLGASLSPPESGTLYLKINDSPAELDDNAGQLSVEVRPQ